MAGGATSGGSSAPLEGLESSIEQPPLTATSAAGNLSRIFSASWVAKPPLPLELAPGEIQGFVLAISPDTEPLPPRRAGGRFESPVTFVWTLDPRGGRLAAGAAVASPTPTTSVHLAQWQAERRAADEVLVRVKGQPRVELNRVFEVSLRVRNLSPGARDLIVMFTEPHPSADRGRLSLEAGSSGRLEGGGGGGSDSEDGEVRDISPTNSPTRLFRGPTTATATGARGADRPTALDVRGGAPNASRAVASAPTSLGDSLLPVDAAVPLGRLERGAERGATVRLTASRTGLARLSSLCLRDTETGAVYAPAHPYEVFVEG